MKTENQIIELESRLAFQENSINELNEIITDQQQQLDKLLATVEMLDSRLNMLATNNGSEVASKPEEDIPPHY
ncbi:hypothetical protein MNBD_GAMMA25-2215 [hydrothermal vent metagenome]|uniref:Protein SlyX homolog n=1 Tax=hydrothermal vent metagenome TaxID=652676 RepID=A0A3B1BDX0_9ZZZZ